jgi:site-specific DNA-cytosine methylase
LEKSREPIASSITARGAGEYHAGMQLVGNGKGMIIVHENKSRRRTPHKEAQALRSGASRNYQTVAQGINQPSRGIEPRRDGLAATLKSAQSGTQRPHIEIANALDADGYLRTDARPRDENGKPQLLPIGYRRIRRLTPLECERLQGFPDGWTEGISDTQRYKCLGNAVTVNVIEAIGQKMIGELVL